MIGPTFVISSYSRIRRRQAPTSMSSARDPKFLADGPFESPCCGARLAEVREARLYEARLSPSPAPESLPAPLHDRGHVDVDIGSAGGGEAHIGRCLAA